MRPSYTAGFRLRKQAEPGYKRRESDCNRIHAIGKARFEGCKVGLRCVVLALLYHLRDGFRLFTFHACGFKGAGSLEGVELGGCYARKV